MMYRCLLRPGAPGATLRTTAGVCLCLTAVLALAGCDRQEDIRVYEVSKSTDHHAGMLLTPTAPPVASPVRNLVQWTVPATWHEEPSSSNMILAVFHDNEVHDLDIQVTAFEGDVGGLLANVNRWRRLIALPPITEEQLPEHLQQIDTQGSYGGMIDATNPQTGIRTVAVVINGGAGMSWFVKATGPSALVGTQKETIRAFAESFKFKSAPLATQGNQGGSDATLPPMSTDTQTPGQMPGAHQPSPATGSIGIELLKPNSWVQVAPGSSFTLSAYEIKTPSGDAQVTISSLKGDGGGLLSNINRWRGQLDLQPVAKLADQPMALLDVPNVTALLLDLQAPDTGSKAGQRMLMGVIARSNDTWYIKMTGSTSALASLRSQFITVVQSASFTGAGQ